MANAGKPNGSFCNTDELAIMRNAISQACALRFRCQQRWISVATLGCPSVLVFSSVQIAPILGNANFSLTFKGAAPFSFGLALAQSNVPSESMLALVSVPPCFHILDLTQSTSEISAITSAVGQGVVFLPLPSNPAFLGVELRIQWVVFDNVGPISGGITLCSAQVIRVGEY